MEISTTLFCALLVAGAASGFRWSAPSLKEVKNVCSGADIQLCLNFTIEDGERVKGMEWQVQLEGKGWEPLASYRGNHFIPNSNYSGRLSYHQKHGLQLSCATYLESGNYSVAISIENAHNVLIGPFWRNVSVEVVDPPKTESGELQVIKQREAVRDVSTGAWHVQMSCGNFTDRGHPPVDVIWTIPTSDKGKMTLSSSSSSSSNISYQDGFFHLLVPNPPVGGSYCCSLLPPSPSSSSPSSSSSSSSPSSSSSSPSSSSSSSPSSSSSSSLPAARCLPEDYPLWKTVCVEVEESAARFLVLEARYSTLEKGHSLLEDRMQDLVGDVRNKTDDLQHSLEDAVRSGTTAVYFHARLTSDITISGAPSVMIFGTVISNQGDSYDPATGRFTAPVDGDFVFMATAGPPSSISHSLDILREGTTVARAKALGSNLVATCQAAIPLKAGEKVWVESGVAYSKFEAAITFFTGFQI